MDLFEEICSVPAEETDLLMHYPVPVPWADFLLNPRRLRGSDFLMRWSQGVWTERRLVEAVNRTGRYVALPYGPSGAAPSEDVSELEEYFARLESAGLGVLKRPDLLVFVASDAEAVESLVCDLGGIQELPFLPEDCPEMKQIIARAILAVECENSLWVAKRMPDYGSDLKPMARLGKQLGMKKSAVVPTVILKEEDRVPLQEWERAMKVPIHIWHAFYEVAFGIALSKAEHLIACGAVEPTKQVFQAPSGPTSHKTIYKIYYQHAYVLAEQIEEPRLVAEYIIGKNGHVLPYVRFEGGSLALTQAGLGVLEEAQRARGVRGEDATS